VVALLEEAFSLLAALAADGKTAYAPLVHLRALNTRDEPRSVTSWGWSRWGHGRPNHLVREGDCRVYAVISVRGRCSGRPNGPSAASGSGIEIRLDAPHLTQG
jgi:hypothetical protein